MEKRKIDFCSEAMTRSILNVFSSGTKNFAWPMPKISSVDKLAFVSYEFLALQLVNSINELEAQDYSVEEIAKIIKYPSIAARFLHLTLPKDFTGLTKNELCLIYEKTFDYCSVLQEDLFCLKTRHNKLIGFDIHSLDLDWLDFDKNDGLRKEVASIKAGLFSWTEMLYSIFHNLGHEFHGPYILDSSENCLVTEYHDLSLSGNSQLKLNNIDSITIIESFPKSVGISIDLHNRLLSEKPLIMIDSKVAIFVNGKKCGISELRSINKSIEKGLISATKFINSMDEEEVIRFYSVNLFNLLKPFDKILPKKSFSKKGLFLKLNSAQFAFDENKYFSATNKMKLNSKNIDLCFNPLVDRVHFYKRVEM
ncbi:MAG: hypothetical protein WCW13_04425 [archaeon]|jgi:hypothetical protein